MPDDRTKSIRKLDRVLSAIRSGIDEVVPVQVAHTFLIVAQHEGLEMGELAEMAATNKSTMSRHLLNLSDTLRSGQPGYGLLARHQSPTDLRSVVYTLAPKGKLFLNQLIGILED